MKRFFQFPVKTIVSIASLLLLAGCVGQGKKTHRLFQKKEVGQHRLAESMEALKASLKDAGSKEQVKAVKALRHIEEYHEDSSRRNQALKTLVIAALQLEAGKAKEMSASRLELRLQSKNQQLSLQAMHAYKEAVIGEVGILQANHSLFNEEVNYQFHPLSKEQRDQAALFLTDHFLQLPLLNQVELSRIFGSILASPSRCVKYKTEKRELCIGHDYADQQGFKTAILLQIELWLKTEDLAPLVQVELILALGQTKGLADPKRVESAFYKWSEDTEMPQLVMLLSGAAYRKLVGDFEEIFTNDFRKESHKSTEAAKMDWEQNKADSNLELAEKLNAIRKGPVASETEFATSNFIFAENYRDPSQNISRPFWLVNAEPILFYQLFKQEKGTNKVVPAEWLFSDFYQKHPESVDQRTILFAYSKKALRSGFTIESKKNLLSQLMKQVPAVEEPEDELGIEVEEEGQKAAPLSPFELQERLEMVRLSLESLKKNGEKVEELLNRVEKGFYLQKAPFEQRVYLDTLKALDETFQPETHKKFCKAFQSLDTGSQISALLDWYDTPPETLCKVAFQWKEEGYQDPKAFIPVVLSEAELTEITLNMVKIAEEKKKEQEDQKAAKEKVEEEPVEGEEGTKTDADATTEPAADAPATEQAAP